MRALGIRALLLLGATLGVACSAVLPGSSENIRCVAPDPTTDPCLPARMRCVDGLCRSVCLEDEVCNGVDDDCNGVIDEGIDIDGDGYLGCGGGDCDDSNPDVNPGVAQDLCNNIDDDCDGLLDAADEDNFQRCPAGLVCIPRLAPDSCAEPNCTYPESPGCMMGFVCDTATGVPDCTAGRRVVAPSPHRITARCVSAGTSPTSNRSVNATPSSATTNPSSGTSRIVTVGATFSTRTLVNAGPSVPGDDARTA